MPNPMALDFGRDARKSKKRHGFSKPKSERAPNRTSEIACCGIAMPVVKGSGDSVIEHTRLSWHVCVDQDCPGALLFAFLHGSVDCFRQCMSRRK
jgi:hypothetical protein